MNKLELIEQLAAKANLSRPQSEGAVNGLVEIITSTIKSGGEVTITGFGTFSSKRREARMGVNPQKPQEKNQNPAVTIPKIQTSKNIKRRAKKLGRLSLKIKCTCKKPPDKHFGGFLFMNF